MRITRRVVTASLLAMALSAPAFADDKPTHPALRPGPELSVLRPHDEGLQGRGGQAGPQPLESDGQVSSPKQTADIEAALTKGVKGIVIRPNEVDAMAPALQEAVDAKVPVVTIDRRVPSVTGILGHVGADNVKGGEAQGNLIVKMFPNGATIINLQGQSGASPAIDRNKGLHNVLDKAGQVQDRVRADRQLRPRQGPLGHRSGARRHERRRRRSSSPPMTTWRSARSKRSRRATSRASSSSASTRCPRRWARCATASSPRRSSSSRASRARSACEILADFLKIGKKPAQQINLLTPVAITKDNLKDAERLSEVK